MKKNLSYRRVVVSIFFVTTGYQGNAHPHFPVARTGLTIQVKETAKTNRTGIEVDTIPKGVATANPAFQQTWTSFVHAVRQQNRRQLKGLMVFPLMGAGGCYLPRDRLSDPLQDTTGINAQQFDSLYQQIFDPDAVRQIIAPLSLNDSIIIWQDTGRIARWIKQKQDPGTPTYAYHIEYVHGSREGSKYFLFACFEGRYKWVALFCDGMLLR